MYNPCHQTTLGTFDVFFFGYLSLYVIAFLVLVFFIFHRFLRWFVNRKNGEARYEIFKSAVLFSPLWFLGSLVFLIAEAPSILILEANIVVWILITVILYIYAELYYLVAAFPSVIAYDVIHILNDIFGSEEKSRIVTFWTSLDALKRKRLSIVLFLVVFSSLVVLSNIFLLSEIISYFSALPTYSYSFHILLVVSLAALVFYTILEIFNYGKVHIPRIKHKKFVNLQRAVENVSITTGIPAPDFQILAYNNPTIFSILHNFASKPTIYITAPLLNMADDNELEALVAHEFAYIFSGRILYLKRVHNILIVLRTLAFAFFFLILIRISPFLLIVWSFLLFYTCINVTERVIPNKPSFEIVFKVLNPPLSLVNFLTYFIYYAIARNEEFYADMKTIEFTRYPKGIYSILRKLKTYTGLMERLPNRFSYLYFTAEGTVFNEIPMPQPLIEERESAIEKIDVDLKTSRQPKTREEVKCPRCKSLMRAVMVKGAYQDLRAYYCEKCDGFWFEDWNLWLIGAHPFAGTNLDNRVSRKDIKVVGDLICPRCGVKLLLLEDEKLPSDIKIWYCPVCNGDWISRSGLLKYAAYKEHFLKKGKNL